MVELRMDGDTEPTVCIECSVAECFEAPNVTGAVLYGVAGDEIARLPWPRPLFSVRCVEMFDHILGGVSDFELEEAFAENWEPWE